MLFEVRVWVLMDKDRTVIVKRCVDDDYRSRWICKADEVTGQQAIVTWPSREKAEKSRLNGYLYVHRDVMDSLRTRYGFTFGRYKTVQEEYLTYVEPVEVVVNYSEVGD